MPDGNSTSSECLMRRFQERLDSRAFDDIVLRFISPANAVARHILSDAALAEDAVQEAFLRIIRNRRKYVPGKPFSSWFYTILRNICKDMLRRRDRQVGLVKEAARNVRLSSRRTNCDGDGVGAALLASLPDKPRTVLTLRIVHGLGFGEIAAVLGISEEAAKKRAQRALRRLRELARADRGSLGRRPELPLVPVPMFPPIGAVEMSPDADLERSI